MKLVSALFGSVFALGFTVSAMADVPPYVTIPPVVNGQPNPSYGGSGCPAGSARAVVAPDLKSFTMIFDKYVVNAAGSNSLDRKNCQILINFQFPQGWSYSIARMDYRGFYNLSAGTYGSQQALYYFQGNLQQARLNTVFRGPTSGDYTISDTLGINNLVWSPCGSLSGLNVNTSLIAQVGPNNPNGYATLTTDSADGSVQTTYALQWQRCGH
nr:DUF4360 domain-containing protein [Pigmentibacter ruber]